MRVIVTQLYARCEFYGVVYKKQTNSQTVMRLSVLITLV